MGCCNEFCVLLLYLKHYKDTHLQNEKCKEMNANTIECPCGHQNDQAFKFCIKCGWDLRLKISNIVPSKSQKEAKPAIANSDCKYVKYLNQYWICNICSFWNPNKSKDCMVCCMLKSNVKKAKPTPIVHTAMNSKATWVDMYKQNVQTTEVHKPKAIIIHKKKNVFGWICAQCST